MPTGVKLITILRRSGGFTPSSISGLALWLDASDASTLFQASNGTTPATTDGDVVGYWGDKSGNGKHVIQGTTANKPTLQLAEKNGRNVVQFDGNDLLATVATVALSTFTVIAVFRSSVAGTALLYEHGPAAGTDPGSYLNTSTGVTISVRRGTVNTSWNLSLNWANDNVWRVGSHDYAGTHATHQLAVNGTVQSLTSVASNNPGTGTVTDTIYLGARTGLTIPMTGQIAEFVVYSPALSVANRNSVESYLNAKWAVY